MRPGLNTTLSASRLAVMRTGKTARFCQRNLSGPKARALLAALGCPISRRRWLASRAEVKDRRGTTEEAARMPKEIFCAFGVDVDAVAGWLGSYGGEDSPCDITRGLFAGEVGSPRLLRLFERFGIKTTWFVPGHSAETFPEQMRAVADAGHEIGMHGYSHENPVALTPSRRRRSSTGASRSREAQRQASPRLRRAVVGVRAEDQRVPAEEGHQVRPLLDAQGLRALLRPGRRQLDQDRLLEDRRPG